MFKLGEKLRDRVTGFEGIATSRTEYLNGCVQYVLTPKIKKGETKYPTGVDLDEENLVRVSAGVTPKLKSVRTGGPARPGKQLTHR